jgi:hypothetical protein
MMHVIFGIVALILAVLPPMVTKKDPGATEATLMAVGLAQVGVGGKAMHKSRKQRNANPSK